MEEVEGEHPDFIEARLSFDDSAYRGFRRPNQWTTTGTNTASGGESQPEAVRIHNARLLHFHFSASQLEWFHFRWRVCFIAPFAASCCGFAVAFRTPLRDFVALGRGHSGIIFNASSGLMKIILLLLFSVSFLRVSGNLRRLRLSRRGILFVVVTRYCRNYFFPLLFHRALFLISPRW